MGLHQNVGGGITALIANENTVAKIPDDRSPTADRGEDCYLTTAPRRAILAEIIRLVETPQTCFSDRSFDGSEINQFNNSVMILIALFTSTSSVRKGSFERAP